MRIYIYRAEEGVQSEAKMLVLLATLSKRMYDGWMDGNKH